MTYEARLPSNYSFGTLTSAAAISDTTLTSADFASGLPSGLSTTTYVPVTLQDPSTKIFEVVWVNAHTAASSTATVLRGKEGTSARAWPSGTLWTIAPTIRDGLLPVANRAALPTDPHVGSRAFLQDEQLVLERNTNAWLENRKLISGIYRTTNDGNTSSNTEKIIITTGTLALEPNTLYQLDLWAYYLIGTSGDKFDINIRETNVSGTLIRGVNGSPSTATSFYANAFVRAFVATTTAVNKVYVGTIIRNAGSGVASAQIGTNFMIERVGANSLLTIV